MIKYPSILPFPLLSSTSFKQQSNILRTEMNSGRARQRRRFLSVPTTMAATWQLSKTMATSFEGFYENSLKDNEWFLMKIPTPQGLVEHEVRFVNSPMENYKPIGSGRWNYQANIEVKKREPVSEEIMTKNLLLPKTLEQFVYSIEAAIKSYEE
ncbi:hypothetical protein [Pseudoalteromonas sp. GW168-MNA-CIBAN-0100]|uniref:hypothetical protein n=1 Tax=Pseudoalteromonas sp. GW168-MNA-CIBAN-0100 TaxID=3140434 RepID=UPI00331AE4B4